MCCYVFGSGSYFYDHKRRRKLNRKEKEKNRKSTINQQSFDQTKAIQKKTYLNERKQRQKSGKHLAVNDVIKCLMNVIYSKTSETDAKRTNWCSRSHPHAVIPLCAWSPHVISESDNCRRMGECNFRFSFFFGVFRYFLLAQTTKIKYNFMADHIITSENWNRWSKKWSLASNTVRSFDGVNQNNAEKKKKNCAECKNKAKCLSDTSSSCEGEKCEIVAASRSGKKKKIIMRPNVSS